MAHLASAVRVRPLARAVAHHTAADRWHSQFTGHLPRPLALSPRQAGGQRLRGQRRRAVDLPGRWDPYWYSPTAPADSVLALMACVVLSAVGRLELTLLGLAAKLLARRLATRSRPVPMTSVAAATDRERPLAAAAVPHMQDSHLARRHRSLQRRRPGQPHSAYARLSTCLVLPRPSPGGGTPL